jgi:hypothetical protein
MILERNDYFELVKNGKVSGKASADFDTLEEKVSDIVCEISFSIKNAMVEIHNATKQNKLLLGIEGENVFTITYDDSCGSVYVYSWREDKTYDLEEIESVDRLLDILNWFV